MLYSLHIVVCLALGREHLVEYVQSVLTAILMWSPWMMGIPAQCHSQVMCEAMFSRLMSSMRRHPRMNNADSICDMYVLLKRASQHVKDLVKSRIPVGMYSYIARNLQRLVCGLLNDSVPAIQWERRKAVIVQAMWVGLPEYPVSLSTRVERNHLADSCPKTLYTLKAAVDTNNTTVALFDERVPRATNAQQRAAEQQIALLRRRTSYTERDRTQRLFLPGTLARGP